MKSNLIRLFLKLILLLLIFYIIASAFNGGSYMFVAVSIIFVGVLLSYYNEKKK